LSEPKSYRISPETYRLLAENRDFYKSLRELQDKKETPLRPQAKGADARAESKLRDNGDVEVSLILPIDDNGDPSDGRLYVKDTFVFDPSESVLKSYQRSFENNLKGGEEWKGWLEKYQALAKQEHRPITNPEVQVFAQRVARSYSRPITDSAANTLPEIKAAFTEEGRILATTNQQVLDLDAGLQLKIKDTLNYYSLTKRDGKLEVTLQLSVDDDKDAADGRILLRDKFILNGETLAFERLERQWSLAPESTEAPRFTDALASLQAKPDPAPEAAEAFITKLLPALLPKGPSDLSPALSLMGAPIKIPYGSRQSFAKGGDPAALQSAAKFSLETMQVVAQEQLAQRIDEGRGWASFGNKIDPAAERGAIDSLFKKAAALSAEQPGADPFALLRGLSLDSEGQRLRDRMLGDKVMVELNDLAKEPDPALRSASLAAFARQRLLTESGLGQSAATIAEALKNDPPTRRTAEDILAILEGKGNFGQKVGYILPRFSQEVSKPSMLLGMAAAPFLGTAFELGGLKLGLQLAKGGQLGWKARGLATLAGMSGEALAFTGIHKTIDSLNHDPSKVWENTGGEILSSILLFGAMRTAHLGSGFATARMAEGRLGSLFGKRLGEAGYSGFGITPFGRILEGRFAAAAGAGIPTLTTTGRFASGLLNHGSGILGMQLSGSASRSLGLTPGNGQSFGANFFDATVGYGQAMVGFNLANAATHGKLQPAVSEFKLRVAGMPSGNIERAEAGRPANPEAAPVEGDPERTLVDPPREADPQGAQDPAAPVPSAVEPEVQGGRIREADFASLEGAFRAAGWSPGMQAELSTFVRENFSNDPLHHYAVFGSTQYSEAQILEGLPALLFRLSEAGFDVEDQLRYIQSSREIGSDLGEFLLQSPAMIGVLRANGLDAGQIDSVVANLREDSIRSYQQFRHAVDNHHCVVWRPGMASEFPKIISGLGKLVESGFSARQKTDFLLKSRLSYRAMENFSQALPMVKDWMATEGWSADHALQYLINYSLSFERSRFDAAAVRLQLARHGFGPDFQAEILANLSQFKEYKPQDREIHNLGTLLDFLASRGWSARDSFQVLNSLAKEGGDKTFLQLPSLQWLIQTLEQQWPAPEVKDLVFAFTEHPGSTPDALFYEIGALIPGLESQGWERPAISHFLKQMAEKANGDFHLALEIFKKISQDSPRQEQQKVAGDFLAILSHCNPYNRHQVMSLFQKWGRLFQALGPAFFPSHLELYATVMERWPRIGYSALSNLMEATDAGTISPDLMLHKTWILNFIEKTHAFNPVHYRIYLTEGDRFLEQMSGYAGRILAEDFGVDEVQNLIAHYDRVLEPSSAQRRRPRAAWQHEHDNVSEGERLLLGLIQRVSPASGVSFARDGEMMRLLRQVIAAGDLRSHVPEAWRGKVVSFEMNRGGMDLKPGERLDPEGKIKGLLGQFRLQSGEQEPSHDALTEAMIAYLASGRNPTERQRLRSILFKRAAASEELRGKLQNITELDFTSLTVLQEIFTDADNLPKFLKEAFEHVPRGRGLVTQLGAAISFVGDGDGVVKQIKKLAQNQNIPAERRKEILTNLLKVYKPEGIEEKILSRPDLPQEIKDEIESVIGERPDLTPREIIEEVLQEPRQLIEAEKNKYQYQNQGVQKIGLRAVKGPAFGLHGFLSGVCVAPDIDLWKNPNFKLLAITDENETQALGYIHVYETVIGNKRYLTLPGINPSAEYVGAFSRKQASVLFQKLMAGVKDFAQAGGYDGVYIPKDTVIHSNRGYIQDAIQRAVYPTKAIPTVHWNKLPRPYPFSQVFVVWEKGNPQQP